MIDSNLTSQKVNTLLDTIQKRYRTTKKIQSPAFDYEPIQLNTSFWKHLQFQNNRRPRTFQDMHSRLISIDSMIHILKTSIYYQDYYKGKEKNNIIYFWTIIAIYNGIRYGIIIKRKGKQGRKHLYSIIPNYRGYIPREKTIVK